jgi:hypothetical protein
MARLREFDTEKEKRQKGCIIANSIAELIPHDAEVTARVQRDWIFVRRRASFEMTLILTTMLY